MGALKSPKCSKGHKMADPNLYYRPSDGMRECLKCKLRRAKESNYKIKMKKLEDKNG